MSFLRDLAFVAIFTARPFFSLGWVSHSQRSVPRPFSLVRTRDNASIINVIAARPRDAPRIVCEWRGRIEKRPYTNSMCTQYTSNEVWPSWINGLNPHVPGPQRHHA